MLIVAKLTYDSPTDEELFERNDKYQHESGTTQMEKGGGKK